MKYTVRSGDSLSAIAKAHNAGTWKELWMKNRDSVGDNPDVIYPGTVIDVPFSLTGFVRELITLKKVK